MKITRVDVYPLLLPMLQSFRISGGSVGDQSVGAPHVYVRLVSDDGVVGWGEARPSHRWSYETLESVVSTIRNYIGPALMQTRLDDLRAIEQAMEQVIARGNSIGQPIAKAAVDMAVHDALARACVRPLSYLWLRPAPKSVSLSYLISSRDPQEVETKIQQAIESGYGGIDVKIGFGLRTDLSLLEAVEPYANQLFVRVDANQGYRLGDAKVIGKRLSGLGADVFEQPLPADDLYGHAQLRRHIDVAVALDESVWSARDVLHAARAEACDAIVVKLTKMGGLNRAKLAAEMAREAGFQLLGGGLTESTLGLAASAILFDAVGISTPVDLNGPFFLADDPVVNKGYLHQGGYMLPDGCGLGCEVDLAKLQQFETKVFNS